jgi:hypothetical protein
MGILYTFLNTKENIIRKVLNVLLGINSLGALALVVIVAGFYLSVPQAELMKLLFDVTIVVYVSQEVIRWVIDIVLSKPTKFVRIKERLLALLLFISLFWQEELVSKLGDIFPNINVIDITFVYLGILQLTIIVSYLFDFLRNANFSRIKIHPGAISAISFATVILLGSLLLMLPKSHPIGTHISYVDALFTSTSAVCVTGLSTINIGTEYTLTGQIIIMLLIQVGGIGVMTLSAFLTAILMGGLSFRTSVMLRDIISEDNLSEIGVVLKQITIFTFGIELLGAASMYCSLLPFASSGFDAENLFASVFHSVSSFCNAGFSMYPKQLMEPYIQSNYWFLTTIMILIFIGGIGFLAFSNLFSYIFHKHNPHNMIHIGVVHSY